MKWKLLSHVQLFVTPWNSPSQNMGMGSLSLLQGIFPIQGLIPSLQHFRRILYLLSHKGSPEYNYPPNSLLSNYLLLIYWNLSLLFTQYFSVLFSFVSLFLHKLSLPMQRIKKLSLKDERWHNKMERLHFLSQNFWLIFINDLYEQSKSWIIKAEWSWTIIYKSNNVVTEMCFTIF